MSKANRKDKRVSTVKTASATSAKETKVGLQKNSIVFVIMFVIALVLYGNTTGNGYSMDDELVTLNQKNVEQGFAGIPNILSSRYSINIKQNYEYRPIVLITYAIEYQFFGRNAAASHFFNLLFYALCGFLVFLTIRKLFIESHWILPLLTALIFMILPVHSEVVASLKNRDEMLALIFSLLALQAFLKIKDKINWVWFFGGILLMILAMFSKRSIFPFLVIIPFTFYYIYNFKLVKIVLFSIASLIVFIVLGKLFLAGTLNEAQSVRQVFYFENPLYTGTFSFIERALMIFGTFGFYIKMFFAPYPLVAYYGYNTFPGFEFGFYQVIGLLSAIAIIYTMVKYFKSERPLVYGLVFMCLSLGMFINIVPAVGIVAERFAFQASIGFSLVISVIILKILKADKLSLSDKLGDKGGRLTGIVIGLLVIASILVIPRNNDWKDSNTLYSTDILKVPESAKLNSLMGTVSAGRLNDHVRGINRLSPERVKSNTDSAVSYFRKALAVHSEYAAVNNNLGTIYFNFKGNLDSAGYYFNNAVKLDTTYIEAHFNVGAYYEHKAALQQFKCKWLNSIVNDSASNSQDASLTSALSKNNDVFYFVSLISSNLQQLFRNSVDGKVKGNLKGNAQGIIQAFNAKIPNEISQKVNVVELVDSLASAYKYIGQRGEFHKASLFTDSLLGIHYFPLLTNYFKNEIKQKNLTCSDNFYKKEKTELALYRKKFYVHTLKAFELRTDYWQAYAKMVQMLTEWEMTNELIGLHKLALKSPTAKKSSVYFSLADVYCSKGEYKNAANATINALNELIKLISNLQSSIKDFNSAGNSLTSSALANQKQTHISGMQYYLNKQVGYYQSNNLNEEVKKIKEKYNAILKQ